MPPSSGNTTIPSPSTGLRKAPADELAIRWVFPEAKITVVSLPREGVVVIGRDPESDIMLPGDEISRAHAEIRRDGPLIVVQDRGSRNGVFVRGARIDRAPLSPGDVLRLGDWVGVVVEGGAEIPFGLVAPGLYGSARLRAALEPLERGATSDLPIVIEGETGTGKEWTARAVHQFSARVGPFVAVNCAALPESLAEAELFGYRKGAFTGADRASMGYFRAANGGTLLLDEVIDLPLPLQSKLLRTLEEREVTPLGEPAPVPIDVRVVVAAQQSLRTAVEERRFRADLYARLDGLTVELPPLRDRIEDVPGLFEMKVRAHRSRPYELDGRLVERLCVYDWPFNVREIDLLARKLAVLRPDERKLRASDLPAHFQAEKARGKAVTPSGSTPPPAAETAQERDERDTRNLVAGLRRHHGNVARAAVDARVSRQRAYRLMGARPDMDWREEREEREPPPRGTGV